MKSKNIKVLLVQREVLAKSPVAAFSLINIEIINIEKILSNSLNHLIRKTCSTNIQQLPGCWSCDKNSFHCSFAKHNNFDSATKKKLILVQKRFTELPRFH